MSTIIKIYSKLDFKLFDIFESWSTFLKMSTYIKMYSKFDFKLVDVFEKSYRYNYVHYMLMSMFKKCIHKSKYPWVCSYYSYENVQ